MKGLWKKKAASGKIGLAILAAVMAAVTMSPNGLMAAEQNRVEATTIRQFDQTVTSWEGGALVVVLAAWCAPCRKELPVLVDLYHRFETRGLRMVGMSIDYGGVDAIQPIIDRHDVPFPVFWLGEEGIAHYDISAIPLMMVVRDGEVSERITGIQTKQQLETLVHRVID